MSLTALSLLLLASYAAALGTVIINDQVDKQLDWHNRILTPAYGLTPLGKITIGEVELSSGVQVGMNSLYRTGDCTSSRLTQDSVLYSYQIGYRLLLLAFGDMRFRGISSSGYVRIRENSMQIDFTFFKNETLCSVSLHEYRFIELKDVELGSSDPTLDGEDVEDFIGEDLVKAVNALLDRNQFEQHLQALCPKKTPSS